MPALLQSPDSYCLHIIGTLFKPSQGGPAHSICSVAYLLLLLLLFDTHTFIGAVHHKDNLI